MAARDAQEIVGLVEEFHCSVQFEPDQTVDLVAGMVADDPRLVWVDDLAERTWTSVRRLQRLFAEYVGVGPKLMIRRHRMQNATARPARGADRLGLLVRHRAGRRAARSPR